MADTAVVTPHDTRKLWSVITASSVGTLIEWYDFYIFGSLAVIFSEHFFPTGNPTVAFLNTLGIFGAGFVVRPFGALVFGRLGDLIGRKYTFLVTLIIMGGSTFAIGLIPGYDTLGIFAPLIVLLLRLLQGLALGGEYGGAATYVAEHAPAAKRGFYTSFIQTTATLGLFLSIGVILAVKYSVGLEAFNDWGWRVPFLLSALLVGVSIYIRLRMAESPLFTKIKAEGKLSKNPLKESFAKKANLKLVLLALFGATAGQGVVWYTGQFYAMTFIERTLLVNSDQTWYIIATALVIGTPLFIYFGWLSDKIGRKNIMMAGMLLAVLLYIPIYKQMYALADVAGKTAIHEETADISRTTSAEGESVVTTRKIKSFDDGNKLTETTTETVKAGLPNPVLKVKNEKTLSDRNFWFMVFLVFVQVIFVAMVYGPIAAFLVELFPTRIRYTSMSLPYHIGNGIFGGLTPYIATSLYVASKTEANPDGDPYAGLYYPIVVAAICFVIGMVFLSNKRKADVMN
ncbi:MAG: MHS family MFS transporter [Bacteroidota bacterium]|nr:MHS family MFS transporter [Bacteroidota bacterium]